MTDFVGYAEFRDDPPCTDCGGTGVTYQTERRCSCQPVVDDPQPVAVPDIERLRKLLAKATQRSSGANWLSAVLKANEARIELEQHEVWLPALLDHIATEPERIKAAVDAAVAAERERCAGIADDIEASAWRDWKANYVMLDQGRSDGAGEVAAAIRQGDTP